MTTNPLLALHIIKVFSYNKSIQELKRGTAQKELNSLKIDLQAFKDELAMLDIAEAEIRELGQIQGKEKLFKKDYVEIKKDLLEQFKNIVLIIIKKILI